MSALKGARWTPTTKPVVVGIDGSQEALAAELWAVGEAVGQGAPLRLLYVIRTDLRGPGRRELFSWRIDTPSCRKLPDPSSYEYGVRQRFMRGLARRRK